jgi:small nuclear ribonucleoprotein (snRNP)-like protein
MELHDKSVELTIDRESESAQKEEKPNKRMILGFVKEQDGTSEVYVSRKGNGGKIKGRLDEFDQHIDGLINSEENENDQIMDDRSSRMKKSVSMKKVSHE